jgi:hypothetical protein
MDKAILHIFLNSVQQQISYSQLNKTVCITNLWSKSQIKLTSSYRHYSPVTQQQMQTSKIMFLYLNTIPWRNTKSVEVKYYTQLTCAPVKHQWSASYFGNLNYKKCVNGMCHTHSKFSVEDEHLYAPNGNWTWPSRLLVTLITEPSELIFKWPQPSEINHNGKHTSPHMLIC